MWRRAFYVSVQEASGHRSFVTWLTMLFRLLQNSHTIQARLRTVCVRKGAMTNELFECFAGGYESAVTHAGYARKGFSAFGRSYVVISSRCPSGSAK